MILLHAVCRYLQNGWQITTAAPNEGLATKLKKILMTSATKVNGECHSPKQASAPVFMFLSVARHLSCWTCMGSFTRIPVKIMSMRKSGISEWLAAMRAGASIKSGMLNVPAALALVPLKPNIEGVGAFSSDFGVHHHPHMKLTMSLASIDSALSYIAHKRLLA